MEDMTSFQQILFWVGSVGIWVIIPACITFVYRYASKSPWKSEPIGKAIMALMFCVGLLLTIGLIYSTWGFNVTWFLTIRAILYPITGVVFWWITILLIRLQDHEREEGRPQPRRGESSLEDSSE